MYNAQAFLVIAVAIFGSGYSLLSLRSGLIKNILLYESCRHVRITNTQTDIHIHTHARTRIHAIKINQKQIELLYNKLYSTYVMQLGSVSLSKS